MLYPENGTCEIVHKIFEMYDSGKRISEIIKYLYGMRVHRPTEYQKTKHIYCRDGEALKQWSEVTLKTLLTNPIYIGTLIQKQGKVEQPIIIENAHEGIVSKGLFYRVADRGENRKSEKPIFYDKAEHIPDIFQNVLFCGECGHKLKRICTSKKQSYNQVLRRYVYGCPNISRIDEDNCKSHFIPQKTIEEVVMQIMKKEFLLNEMKAKHYISFNHDMAQKKKSRFLQEQKEVEEQVECIGLDLSKAYMEYRQNKITKEHFLNYKEKMESMKDILKQSVGALQEKQNQIDEKAESVNERIRALVRCEDGERLTYDLIHALIKRIDVYADAQMEIQFYFRRSELLLEKKGDKRRD